MHIRGARRVEIIDLRDPEQLMQVLQDAIALRSCEVTERNPISSRSHAVCSIELLHVVGTGIDGCRSTINSTINDDNNENYNRNTCQVDNVTKANHHHHQKKVMSLQDYLSQQRNSSVSDDVHSDDVLQEVVKTTIGKVTLVDLAGSERNYETIQMTAAQHRESADINFALMALKDCFRAYHMQLLTKSKSKNVVVDIDSPGINSTNRPSSDRPSSGLFTSTSELSQCMKPSIMSSHKDDHNNSRNTSNDNYRPNNQDQQQQQQQYGAHTCTIEDVKSSSRSSTKDRIPFRSSLLTRVLKSCFTSGTSHRTTIIATISPTPTDLQHTINTISHTVLMCPELHRLTHRVTVEVPLFTSTPHQVSNNDHNDYSNSSNSGHRYKPIHDWTSKDVLLWIANVERVRFAHVVLPKDIDGKALLQLSVSRLNDLFASSASNKARNQKEGMQKNSLDLLCMVFNHCRYKHSQSCVDHSS